MRLLTWNVWFGEHKFEKRTAALIGEIAQRRPEVIALQEVRPELREVLVNEIAGYQTYGGELMLDYDVMLLTRVPVRASRAIELPSQMGRRVLAVELASGLTIAAVHLESTAGCAPARAAQLSIISPALAAASPDVCFVGDMNFRPGAVAESRALDPGFIDVWPALRPNEAGYTVDTEVNTMRAQFSASVRKRIDRVFVRSMRWTARSIEIVGTEPIDGEGTFTSDHFGLQVELDER